MAYYWVVDYTHTKDGRLRPVVIKGRCFTSEIRAQRFIDEAGGLSPRVEIIPLESSTMQGATSELKAKLITRYKDLDKGMTRAVHQNPGGTR